MRHFLLVIAMLTLAGCGSADATAPQPGVVYFRIDSQTCVGTATFQFFIDGKGVGSQVLSAGNTSHGFQTSAGQHTVGASDTGNQSWGPITVQVPAEGSFTQLLTC